MKEQRDLIQIFDFIEPGQCYECRTNMVVHTFESNTFRLNKYGEPIDTIQSQDIVVAICPKCGCTKSMMYDVQTMAYIPITDSLLLELQENQKNIDDYDDDKSNPFVQSLMKGVRSI